jgi:hypothetical protein
MQQILWLGKTPITKNLGPAPEHMSLREFVEGKTYHEVYKKRVTATKKVTRARKEYRANLEAVARIRAKHYI